MSRVHIPARPTIYRGIRMRSRMEARFAQALDSDGVEWEYEPICFANETGQYLPDFRLAFVDDDRKYVLYIELKPYIELPEKVRLYQRRMEIIWSSEPDALLLLMNVSEPPDYLALKDRRWRESRTLRSWVEDRVDDDDEVARAFGLIP